MKRNSRVRVIRGRLSRLWFVFHQHEQVNERGFESLYQAHSFATLYSQSVEYLARDMGVSVDILEPTG